MKTKIKILGIVCVILLITLLSMCVIGAVIDADPNKGTYYNVFIFIKATTLVLYAIWFGLSIYQIEKEEEEEKANN